MWHVFSGGRKALCALGVGLICLVGAANAQAQGIFAPSDGPNVIGGASDGTNFNKAVAGTVDGVNNFPAAESPDHLVDGVGQKYLNFAKTNTGFILTPGLGSTIAGSIKLWTANDSEPRDPSSYQLYGTNNTITGNGPFPISNFTLISSGALTLPATRNGGGVAALDDANSQTVTFANSTAYSTYMVLFPDVKTNASANSMQIAEVQLIQAPEPGTIGLLGLGGIAALLRRRR